MDLSAEDAAYVRHWFVPLATVLAGRDDLDTACLPGPAYILDGVPMVAADHLALVDAAGSLDAVPAYFAARYTQAAGRLARAPSLDEAWEGYASGVFAVCLRVVTPETIAIKEHLVATIDQALAAPRPSDRTWRRELRIAVTALDALEREFCAYDRTRFAEVSRDRCIAAVRREYADVFV